MPNTGSMPWRLVIAGCVGMFAATATGSTRSPFLPDMAADLQVSLPAIANLFGVTAAAWGTSSYLVGYVSDRIGRKPFLIGSPALLALIMGAVSVVPTYGLLVAITILAAVCCGAFTSTSLAEVSIRTPVSFHGRALGYVMSGQSLTLLFGVPVAAWLGALIGWRGMHLVLAGLALVAAAGMWNAIRETATRAPATPVASKPRTALRSALTGPIVRLFLALIAERVCFGLAAFYYAAYLRRVYDLPIEAVALPLVGFALGNIIGTVAGGQLADRFPYRRISFASALLVAGSVAIPWFMWRPGLAVTVALGVLFAFFNALGRPSLLAALADVPADVRGVVMGMNSSIASIGWLIAALVGGWLYAGIGFSGFGLLMAAMCLVGALVVVPDSRIRRSNNQ
ncbi:MAG: MFS transporter [Granulosicoccus sp.]|nr:MFS transporter [Granulosicoccus sp.]